MRRWRRGERERDGERVRFRGGDIDIASTVISAAG